MRFGMFIPQGWRLDLVGIDPSEHWNTMSKVAQHADAHEEWESVWVYDHFHTVPAPTEEATHEAYTVLSAVAATTSRVRLGQMCTCVSYRNPAYLAKVAATIDIISGGRMELGIGAGWYEHEWKAYGYGFPRAGERLARLDEGVQIIRQLWRDGISSFTGKHYQTSGALCRPLPLQEGGIPVWVAGGGEKKTLRIAAEYGNYTNFDGTLDGFRRKSEVLAQHCADVGRDPAEITRSANYIVIIGQTDAEVEHKIERLNDRIKPFLGPDDQDQVNRWTSSRTAIGTPEQIVENLSALKAAGLGYAITVFPDAAYDLSSVELFQREVIPALQ
ncbi:LLM class F420-dependent oxidoreductase [Saxibacter everestensis]|uniref:LLM class F420-dependent oxidoreductase n=1 Tax=Saxibacter everestensis TaxID=2909229 RepID=A0ABY8QYI3_9MICO|nr:LLM class F420-dependent oxidoreductase [Brevibacteriaceae bacterium ZFBP1038]